MAEEIDNAITEWARLLGAGDYFAAHEVLESPWLAAEEPEKTFLKGLIHVAVALYHHQRGNSHGARVKYHSALRYLEPYQPTYRWLDLAGLFTRLRPYFDSPLGASLPSPPTSIHVVRLPRD